MKTLKTIFYVSLLLCLTHLLKASEYDTLSINNDIKLIHLQDSIFIHLSFHSGENFGRFASNGLLIIRNGKAILVDTPYDNEKTEILASYLKDSMQVNIETLIAGHFHADCLGGLEYLHATGVKSIANLLTLEKCKEFYLPMPTQSFTDSLEINFQEEKIICNYFGGGHTIDNITVYLPKQKILFGGCLVKSTNSRTLGNLQDAVVEDWDNTIRKLIERYPDINIIVPGHGEAGGIKFLRHTQELVDKKKNY